MYIKSNNATVFSTKSSCLDGYGRVTLPRYIRTKMQLEELQKFKISCDENTIYLKKILPHCDFCDSTEASFTVGKKHACKECMSSFKDYFIKASDEPIAKVSYIKYDNFVEDSNDSITPISTSKLSTRTRNALIKHGYSTIEEVCKETPSTLLEHVNGLGKKHMTELFKYIEMTGLSFKKT